MMELEIELEIEALHIKHVYKKPQKMVSFFYFFAVPNLR